jgi:hypothetical protein
MSKMRVWRCLDSLHIYSKVGPRVITLTCHEPRLMRGWASALDSEEVLAWIVDVAIFCEGERRSFGWINFVWILVFGYVCLDACVCVGQGLVKQLIIGLP